MRTLFLLGGALAATAAVAVPLYVSVTTPAMTDLPEIVVITPGDYEYRPSGSYRVNGRLVDPPLEHYRAEKPLEIMKYQVARADYAACVADGACEAPKETKAPGRDLPLTGVNWFDANAYAAWFSLQTRQHWRLPDDREWQRAAAERFVYEEVVVNDIDDPAQRWLADYARNVATRGVSYALPQLRGTFGDNSLGVADLGGNVWEWTSSCVANVLLAADRTTALKQDDYCGAHIAEGKHRAIIIDLVRDPKVGGCAAGLPPDYVGFRLVREH